MDAADGDQPDHWRRAAAAHVRGGLGCTEGCQRGACSTLCGDSGKASAAQAVFRRTRLPPTCPARCRPACPPQ